MGKPYSSDSDNYVDKFMPIWKQYRRSQNALIIIWALFIIISFCFRDVAVAKNMLKVLSPFLFIPTLIWAFYFHLFKLRCPKCGNLLSSWKVGGGWFYFTGVCPNCNAQLKKRWLTKESQVKLGKILLPIVIIVFILGIIAAFMTGGIEITRG